MTALMRLARALLLVVCSLSVPRSSGAQVSAADSAWLMRTTQALLDAITYGDSAVWARHLAPRWFITDEEGRSITRSAFLKELRGLPPGQQGRLQVQHPSFVSAPGVLVMSYESNEWHNYYGQVLRTIFHQTDTWVRQGNAWVMLAAQTIALPTPIPGKALPAALLGRYVGSYTLTPEIQLAIVAADSGLILMRPLRPAEQLYALDERTFIRHGVRGFWIFEVDNAGAASTLVNWRDNNAVVWHRN